MLKDNPAQLKKNILENFVEWATLYIFKKHVSVFSEHSPSDADELMDAWREILKDELAAVG